VHSDRGLALDEVLPAFREASDWYLAAVEGVDPAQFGAPGLGEWSVLELVAHASRAYLTLERYLQPSGRIDIETGADFFRLALADPTMNAAVAARGRDEVAALGDDPVATIRARAASALVAVEGAAPGAVCVTFAGTLSLADYLATRVVELTIHTLDLAAAVGGDGAEPPGAAARVSLIVLSGLAAQPSSAVLLRALTGRAELPHGFTAFP